MHPTTEETEPTAQLALAELTDIRELGIALKAFPGDEELVLLGNTEVSVATLSAVMDDLMRVRERVGGHSRLHPVTSRTEAHRLLLELANGPEPDIPHPYAGLFHVYGLTHYGLKPNSRIMLSHVADCMRALIKPTTYELRNPLSRTAALRADHRELALAA